MIWKRRRSADGSASHLPALDRGRQSQTDGHLSDELLLLAIDGEISSSEVERVQLHVESCWKCRARKEQIERAIENLVEYDDLVIRPAVPPANAAVFFARLDALESELGRPRYWRRLFLAVAEFVHNAWLGQLAWTAAVVLVGFAFGYLFLIRNVRTVSARELLQEAQTSTSKALDAVKEPVVYQRLHVVVNGRSITRASYHDVVRRRHRVDVTEGNGRQIQDTFHRASWDWDDPLSVDQYSHWREELLDRHDDVVRVGSDALQLRTTTSSGPVVEASVTVRAMDFHPTGETLKLRDNSEIEITELTWRVLSFGSLNADVFASQAEPAVLAKADQSHLPALEAGHSMADLAEAELQARLALHEVGGDLSDDVDIRLQSQGRVTIDALTATEERKQQLISALEGIPLTEVHVRTLEEAAKQHPALASEPEALVVTVESRPLLDAELRERFPKGEERTEFVNQTVALSQEAAARAWALRRLANRYGRSEVASLSHTSRQKLQALVSDHISTLLQDFNRLQGQLSLVLPASPDNTATLPPATDWRERVKRLHSSVEMVNEAIDALFASSASQYRADDSKTLQAELQRILAQIGPELEALRQQVQKEI